ncbi:hypothetical protein PR048_021947 [Dryococelus australis]|uniref:Uncharacterized protein n=1 Tax=Dryococelus australis TaxID=614101 RepID=A0ABQ9GZR6_9NEOP|nr:hypothetical protein PR048_021947 [Dryococelus australis]
MSRWNSIDFIQFDDLTHTHITCITTHAVPLKEFLATIFLSDTSLSVDTCSHFDYFNVVYNDLMANLSMRLQRLQNLFVCFVTI